MSSCETSSWKMLPRDNLHFRFVPDPIFNLSTQEFAILNMLRAKGLNFKLLPRFDPTSFLRIEAELNGCYQTVEIAVETGTPTYVSFITKRNAFAEHLLAFLRLALGHDNFDHSRLVKTRDYFWCSFFLPQDEHHLNISTETLLNERKPFFNFSPKELYFLQALSKATSKLATSTTSLQFRIYPRETGEGFIEMMISDGNQSQPAKIIAKGLYPITYYFTTENNTLGRKVIPYIHEALGSANFQPLESDLEGAHLTLVYTVSLPHGFHKNGGYSQRKTSRPLNKGNLFKRYPPPTAPSLPFSS